MIRLPKGELVFNFASSGMSGGNSKIEPLLVTWQLILPFRGVSFSRSKTMCLTAGNGTEKLSTPLYGRIPGSIGNGGSQCVWSRTIARGTVIKKHPFPSLSNVGWSSGLHSIVACTDLLPPLFFMISLNSSRLIFSPSVPGAANEPLP